MRFRPFLRATPRVRLSRPGAGCVARIPLIVLTLLALASALVGQEVTAIATLDRNRYAVLHVGNPTTTPVRVVVEGLFRDASDSSQVKLGDSVAALISPRVFVLQAGERQTIRILVQDSVAAVELLRLATLFDPAPLDSVVVQQSRLTVRTRLITKVRASP